jgi:hypothetical protein
LDSWRVGTEDGWIGKQARHSEGRKFKRWRFEWQAWIPPFDAIKGRHLPEGKIMETSLETKNIKQLLDEADELIHRIDSDTLEEMKEEHRLQFELYTQKLERIKSEIQRGVETKETSKADYGAEGFHEAILDIVEAMKGLTKFLA